MELFEDGAEIELFEHSGQLIGEGRVLSRRRMTSYNATAAGCEYEYYVRGDNFGLWVPQNRVGRKVTECPHAWEEYESQGTNEYFTDVLCTRCLVRGQRDNATGAVFYPAT